MLVLVGVFVITGTVVFVSADVAAKVGIIVAKGVDKPLNNRINLGDLDPDSRDDRLIAVDPGVNKLKLYEPSPVTYEVISKVIQLPPLVDCVENKVFPAVGAFE